MNNNFLENVFLTTRHWLSGRRDTGTAHHPVTTVNDFGELSPEQRRRLSVVESEDVFSSFQWFELLSLTTFCTEPLASQFIYLLDTATDEHAAITTCLPMIACRQGRSRFLKPLANFYSPLFAPVAEPRHAAQLVAAFAGAVAGDKPSWDIVQLYPLDAQSPFFADAQAALKKHGFLVGTYFCHANWYLDVAGRSFNDYFAALPSVLRNTVRRARRQLSRRQDLAIRWCTEEGELLDYCVRAFEAIYGHSWKKPEPYPAFIPGLCRLAARQGWLRLCVLELDNKPVAAQIWLTHNGTASIFKLAHDQSYDRLSVGSVLTATMMQHAIDVDRVSTVDYLIGDDSYKKLWMSHRRERQGIIGFNTGTVAGLVQATRHFGGRMLGRMGFHHQHVDVEDQQ